MMLPATTGRVPRAERPVRRSFVIVVLLALFALANATPGRAQQSRSSWRGDWGVSARARFDSNVFRLNASQRASLEDAAGQGRFADMSQPSDLVIRAELGGSVRGRGLGSRRVEIGGAVAIDAYTANSSLTHLSLQTFVSQSLTSRDELTLELDYDPDEFRRNYLAGGGTSGAPTYAAGTIARTRARFTYGREVRKGTDHDLDLEVTVTGSQRSVSDLPWRDRTELAAGLAMRIELSRRVDGELLLSRGRLAYDGSPEPFMDGTVVNTASLVRDLDETELGARLRIDLRHRKKLLVGWERRVRDYVAALGDDPVYGDRRDDRDTFEAEFRYDLRGPLDFRAGASYRKQDTLRPARGDTTDEEDYRQTRVSVSLRYTR